MSGGTPSTQDGLGVRAGIDFAYRRGMTRSVAPRSLITPSARRSGFRRVLAIYLAAVLTSSMACSSEPAPASSQPAQPAPAQERTPAAATDGREQPKEKRTGVASFIAERFEGRKTASGETYDGDQLVAAHPTYPLGTVIRVTNEENGRVVQVKIIDRSAAGPNRPIIDLSRAAAERLDFTRDGIVNVTTEVIEWGQGRPEP